MKSSNPIILSFFLVGVFQIVYSDLPVKCLPHQIEGDWKFEYTKPVSKVAFTEVNCGHEFPDKESNSASVYQNEFKAYKSFDAKFGADGCFDCSLTSSPTDKKLWTTVYNEGVDFNVGSKNIFTFFYYQKKDGGGYESICSKTAVGWFVDEKTKEFACIRGSKISGKKEVNQMSNTKKLVVEGVVKDVPIDQTNTEEIFKRSSKVNRLTKFRRFRFKSLVTSKLQLTSSFTDFDSYVKILNSNPNSTWKAKNYDAYKNMTLKDLNRFMGRSKGNDLSYYYPQKSPPNMRFKSNHLNSAKGEPNEYFSWENCISTAKSQGGCGSCFALSSLSSIESRLRLKDKKCEAILKEPSIEEYEKINEKKEENQKISMVSIDHTLDCNFYNQGCDGGYPYLVGKFAHDHHLVLEGDYKKSDEDPKKRCSKIAMGQKVVKAKSYGYIGGRYSLADEEAIKKEIKENGPIVLSFEPGSSLGFYDEGLYNNLDTWVTKHATKPEWTQVDHSVLAYGYGSDAKGNKYWLLQNSWGKSFGEHGNFKMVRGVDQDGIESMAEFADPYLE